MDRLTPDQARVLRDAVRSRANYFHRVRVRMYRIGIHKTEPLYELFGLAEEAVQRLAAELHNRSLGPGRPWEPVSPPPDPDTGPRSCAG
jgi:hypothetical protein